MEIIYNPYSHIDWGNVNRYWGSFHTHSFEEHNDLEDWEEGDSWRVQDNVEAHDNEGFDFLISGLRTYPWEDFEVNTDEIDVQQIRAGELKGRPHHLVSMFQGHEGGGATPNGHRHEDIQIIGNNDGLCFFTHPGRYYEYIWEYIWFDEAPSWYEYWSSYIPYFRDYDQLVGMEIFNKGTGYHDININNWDVLLRMLEVPIWGFSENDARRESQFELNNCNIFFLEKNTEEALKNEVKNGGFVFAYNYDNGFNFPQINKIEVNENSNIVTIDAENYSEIKWYTDHNKEIYTGEEINYKDEQVKHYLRAVIYNDSGGEVWTQPIRFDYSFYKWSSPTKWVKGKF